ncbi:hypothetical protein VCSRO18_3341 [Vibrio cholerae]|uniref:hypothetical protein n=1 Tax=Vibrio cholerae TaxID=666 RepID=UPI0011D71648|nr:hypothetical protein [Vibrio cholerae]EJL6876770.1 hypothetical protein [Vibrio cholerae]TXZ83256.1 hypothetical protein FXE49_05690 [Vibrio cholerae]GIA39266.1 hypothetical protein VCSRO18_3341 [Vibrio cholerae]
MSNVVTDLNFEKLEKQTLLQKKNAITRFRRIHGAMYGEISSMLRIAKLAPMNELQNHEPSFTAMANELEQYLESLIRLHEIFDSINVSDVNHAREYLDLVKNLAKAIEADDYDGLCEAIAALDEKPYI